MDTCRSWQSAVPPVFSMAIVVWAVVFLQFWRRTNAEILTRFATAELWNSHLQIVVAFYLGFVPALVVSNQLQIVSSMWGHCRQYVQLIKGTQTETKCDVQLIQKLQHMVYVGGRLVAKMMNFKP